MSLRVNLNSAALTAHRNLAGADTAMGKSIERLSSGLKINSAGDDPAGLVISEKLRAQVSGIGQGIKNSGDAVNMVKTAEGALNEVSSVLRSMRDLALHARNSGANDSAAVDADQQQINSAIETLNKISTETQFGNKKLLDGSAGVNSVISGAGVYSANVSSGVTADADVYVDVTTAATKASLLSTAAAVDTTSAFVANGTFTINGVGVTVAAGDKYSDVISKINAVSDQTGVVAATALDGAKKIVLSTKEYGSSARIDIVGSTFDGSASAAAIGIDAVASVSTDDAATTGVGDNAVAWNKGTGLILKSDKGDTISLTDTAGSAVADLTKQMTLKAGTLSFQVGAYQGQTRSLAIGSTAATNLGSSVIVGQSVQTIDVRSTTGADDAIKVLDQSITDVSNLRAKLGAFQKNVLESNINSLNVAKENISASESSIRDTDMAEEMVNFTRNQILQQAGTAMLSQANQAPQQLLSLLR